MSDEEEAVDTSKSSRRDRFKNAIARTKTKLRRKDAQSEDSDTKSNDDIDDFLSVGRVSTSSRPSTSDSLSFASGPRSTADSLPHHPSPRVSPPDRLPAPQQSPRRIVVPRIDVSRSQRWPDAQPVPQDEHQHRNFLRADHQGRSQSVSSMSKGRGRARGLSVSFIEAPPIVIGEGGDEAQTPPVEISRARARARSFSPMPNRQLLNFPRPSANEPPYGRRVSPEPPRHHQPPPPARFHPQPIHRVPTGFNNTPMPTSKTALDKEFDMSLGFGSDMAGSDNPPGKLSTPSTGHGPTMLHSPRPVRPPVPVPTVKELKAAHGSGDLHSKFAESNTTLPRTRQREFSDASTNSDIQSPEPRLGSGHGRFEQGGSQRTRDYTANEQRSGSRDDAPGNWI